MKNIAKTIIALSLAFSFLLAGVLTLGSSYAANLNEGVLLAHDGPSNRAIVH